MSRKDKKIDFVEPDQEVEVKKVEQDLTINLTSYLAAKKIKRYEWDPREVFASKHGKERLTFQEWDEFFKKY